MFKRILTLLVFIPTLIFTQTVDYSDTDVGLTVLPDSTKQGYPESGDTVEAALDLRTKAYLYKVVKKIGLGVDLPSTVREVLIVSATNDSTVWRVLEFDDIPDLSGTYLLLTKVRDSVVTVLDDSSVSKLGSEIDISDESNLTAGDALTLNDDDIDFDGGASPAGELGGTWASPTVDAGIHDDEYLQLSAIRDTMSNVINDSGLVDTSQVRSEISDSVATHDNFSELAGTVGDAQIADGAVDGGASGEIADNSITNDDMADNSIDSDDYVDDSIDDAHINWGTGANQVSTDDITEGSTNLYNMPDTLTQWWGLMDTVIVEDLPGWKVPYDITIIEIAGYTDANTTTFNVEERAEGTPNTAGTDAMASDLVADNDQQEQTSFDNAGFAKDTWMVPTISATGDVSKFNITVRYVKD